MLKIISRFCTRFPWLVILAVFAVTALFVMQMAENLQFEADLTKSLPTNIVAVKSDDYYKKNFNHQDTLLIGVEKKDGSVMELGVLRKIEQIVLEIADLKASKTFQSRLTGKEETLLQSVGIDTENINSIANLEDAVLDKETGSVVSGSVIKKLKKDFGIASAPGMEERLPKDDGEMRKIIPELTNRILRDRTFRNNLLSEDKHAATIAVSMLRKWNYKKRYAILELSTALDENQLKSRFQGKESTFPFNIYGKTLNGIKVDDNYLSQHAQSTRRKLAGWLSEEFSGITKDHPGLQDRLNQKLTAENFQAIMAYTEQKDFFITQNMNTWENFINSLWDFTLEQIDPFSRENLEFQLHNVKDIFDLEEVYQLVNNILKKHSLDGVNYYVAGTPVVIGVISAMMQKDMGTLMPIAILMVLLVLALSFRSFRGVIIPALTVVLSVIWTLGLMAILKIPLTAGTSAMPIILLGVGSAYGIHLLNRYKEDSLLFSNRKELVRNSIKHVGVAVTMAAITTIAGFSSLATSDLSTIREFGIFAAVGVFFALFLSLTLTPSLLVIWRLPSQKAVTKNTNASTSKEGLTLRLMRNSAETVAHHPRSAFVLLLLVFIGGGILATGNHFEGAMMRNFKEDNPLFQSDRFLNKNLSGTTNINLIFKFRDVVSLENPQSQSDFKARLSGFSTAWNTLTADRPEFSPAIKIVNELESEAKHLPGSLNQIESRFQLVRDILNEEFMVEATGNNESEGNSDLLDTGGNNSESMDLLEALDDSGGLDDMSALADMDETKAEEAVNRPFGDLSPEQVLGLKNINERLGLAADKWESTGEMVLKLRKIKTTPDGLRMQRHLNLTYDYLEVDIKQPEVLHKLEELHHFLKNLEEPVVTIQNRKYLPTSFVMTPVDVIRKFYMVFYHNDNPAFDRLPDVAKDGFTDITLTDRAINGVVLNQALSGNRDGFEAIISPDLKEFQVQTMLRDGSRSTINKYLELSLAEINRLFPDDDPYIESVRVGGAAPTSNAINEMLSQSQVKSIALSFVFVFAVTFFIFRSATGGIFSLIPLAFTVVLNFGLIRLISGEINVATMMVASISIGTGVDYTIHFLERLKIQLKSGDDLADAYINTVMSSGKAILMNALAVAMGFFILIFSVFIPQQLMGILMAATMFFSSVGALVLLPAVVLLTRPRYLTRLIPGTVTTNEKKS